ncbi:MAG: radical SAM family heme chaperone HemW [Congregibacter sp.]
MPQPPLSLYVHLPWCERKCPYCDFNSHERTDLPENAYVEQLLTDLQQELEGEQRPLETVFIGGGTPSLFSAHAIEKLMSGIRQYGDLTTSAEITMEANPGSVERSRLAAYAASGINRFSLGIQSFNNASLQVLGRVHDCADAYAAIDAARESGADSFNTDLMHGLPYQDVQQGLEDLHVAIGAAAPHLSWYQLTIEPNTRFYSHPPRLPVEDVLASLEDEGAALLQNAGFERYEVSAWAQPGHACQHNMNYWRFGDYLAIGAGAHGKTTGSDGNILRYSKPRQPEDYLGDAGTRRCAVRELDIGDRRGEFMLNALRLTEGFSLGLFENRTGLNPSTVRAELDTLVDEKLLHCEGEQYFASELGRRFLDTVVGRFF